VSRGSIVGDCKVFCRFEDGGRVEGDGLGFDAVDFCGVGVFGVGGRDWYLGEEPPITFF
jgi:hypothetical protein